MVQADSAPQPFGIEIYADNGSGTAPTPADAIVPIASAAQTSQTNLGAFGAGTSLFEASFDTPGLELAADTVFWISSFGATGASNSGGFNNFFATSAGAPSTSPNGVIIAPNSGVTNWTLVQDVVGPPALHFSFAIDGVCAALVTPVSEVPTLSIWALGGLALALSLGALVARRRLAS
jgi:hypothetical protein